MKKNKKKMFDFNLLDDKMKDFQSLGPEISEEEIEVIKHLFFECEKINNFESIQQKIKWEKEVMVWYIKENVEDLWWQSKYQN